MPGWGDTEPRKGIQEPQENGHACPRWVQDILQLYEKALCSRRQDSCRGSGNHDRRQGQVEDGNPEFSPNCDQKLDRFSIQRRSRYRHFRPYITKITQYQIWQANWQYCQIQEFIHADQLN